MKAPAFQLYPQDFISSLDCQTMAPEEFGVYCWLLFHSWIQEPQCYLPNDPEKLSKLLRINPRTFAKMWRNSLEKKFKISNCGNYLYNERLIKELEKQDSYRKKQAQNGSKGGRPKANDNPEKAVGYSGLTQTEPKKSSSISTSTSSSFSTSTSDILLEKEPKSELVLEVENSESLTAKTEKPKEKSSAKKEKVAEDETELTPFEMFQSIHQVWPANKRSAKTDWVDFEKKYKKEFTADFFRAIYRGIQNKIKYHRHLQSINAKFIPEWPHLKTYLNQRRWEEQTDLTIPIQTNGSATNQSQQQSGNQPTAVQLAWSIAS